MSAGEGEEGDEPRVRLTLLDRGRVYLVVVGFGLPAFGIVAFEIVDRFVGAGVWFLLLAVLVLTAFAGARGERIRSFLGTKLRPLADVVVLGVLVALGLFCNTNAEEFFSSCARPDFQVALAEPEVLGLVALHALTVLAYVISRRRPSALPGPAEPLVHACLIAGIVLHALIVVQLGSLVLWAILPLLLPFATPLLAILVYTDELVSRLRRRGAEADVQHPHPPRGAIFRQAPPQPPLPAAPRVHGPLLVGAIALSLVVLGGWAAAQKRLLGWAPLQAFTRTYLYTLSRRPRDLCLTTPPSGPAPPIDARTSAR